MLLSNMSVIKNLKGATTQLPAEIMAGITVACIALPLALAFGVTAYGPLGPAYGALGAAAGLTGAVLTGFFASLFGGCAPQVTGPTGPMSIAARGAFASLLASPYIEALPVEQRAAAVIWLFAVSAVLGGGIQWLLAWSRLGNLVRGIPYPVVAGFMNGVSLLILFDQLFPALGWTETSRMADMLVWPWPPDASVAVIASTTTVLVLFLLPRVTHKIPASLAALLIGTGVYYAGSWLIEPSLLQIDQNSQLVGRIPQTLPLPILLFNARQWAGLLIRPGILTILFQQALVLGLLGIIDTLLTSVIADLKTGERHNSNHELFGQGLGNILAGVFGALPGAGATVRTLANIEAGGRTGISGMVHALVLLASLLVFAPLVQGIPLPVLAALMVVLAIRMVDYWSIELLRKRSARGDSLILWLVTAVTVAADLIIALTAGLILAAFLFVRRQTALGASVVYSDRRYLKSRVIRSEANEEILVEHGKNIQIVKLTGSLFFGSSDDIMGQLEQQLSGSSIAVLDMEGLRNLDLTGGRMLIDLTKKLQNDGVSLYWGGWQPNMQASRFLIDLGLEEVLAPQRLLPDADAALEKAETENLDRCGFCCEKLTVTQLDFFAALNSQEQAYLSKLFTPLHLQAGDMLYRKGDPGGDLHFILEGIVEIHGNLHDDGNDNEHRIAAYGTGQHLGLTSWLESRPHPYTATALTTVHLACMSGSSLRSMLEAHPSLGLHLMQIWARQLAGRVRRSREREIHRSQLERP